MESSSGEFKKPVFIGKVPKKTKQTQNSKSLNPLPQDVKNQSDKLEENEDVKSLKTEDIHIISETIPYKEPKWSECPSIDTERYYFEVLKSGVILETLDLNSKAYWVFGRLQDCDIVMAHPSVSRYHAVIQYKANDEDSKPKGWYLYDLKSTHGSFVNKMKVPSETYIRVRSGYMIKLGFSTRHYILQGVDSDTPIETEKTITEIKQERENNLKEAQRLHILQVENKQTKLEVDQGISWGMGEDADETTDLSINPYALTTNEELFLDDPKRTLRGYFEREGMELQYNVNETGPGHFVCKVELPISDALGRPIVAECSLKGKKKECVIQCALEACRILDRAGVLRQATHEPRKRKQSSSESDGDDDFWDRTGAVEKRRLRKATASQNKISTLSELLEQEKDILKQIAHLEKTIEQSRKKAEPMQSDSGDALDDFMSGLSHETIDKVTIRKHKIELQRLNSELKNLRKLIQIAQPNVLPALVQSSQSDQLSDKIVTKTPSGQNPLFGKRIPHKSKTSLIKNQVTSENSKIVVSDKTSSQEEMDSEEEDEECHDNNKKLEESTNSPKKNNSHDASILQETSSTLLQKGSPKEEQNDNEISPKKREKKRTRIRERNRDDKNRDTSETKIDELGDQYSTWVPPQGQSGDGRTSLNDKFGY